MLGLGLFVTVPAMAFYTYLAVDTQVADTSHGKPTISDRPADGSGMESSDGPGQSTEENSIQQDAAEENHSAAGQTGSPSSGAGPSTGGSAGNGSSGTGSGAGNQGGGTGGLKPTGPAGTWSLVFQDEFNGNSLDLSKWSNCWFPLSGCGSMNNVATSASNVAVSNGNLILTLASSSSGALVSSDPAWGAKPGFQFGYGVAEARIHFPGNGTHCYNWPAWWTNGQSWPANGENDIAEVLGGRMTVNYHSNSGAANQGAVPGYWCGGFHTYTMHRKAGSVDIYYDGTKVKSYATNDGGAMHYLVLNVGHSSNYPMYGTASQVRVDYVRVWQ